MVSKSPLRIGRFGHEGDGNLSSFDDSPFHAVDDHCHFRETNSAGGTMLTKRQSSLWVNRLSMWYAVIYRQIAVELADG
jgi:hypothetical protein